MENFTCKELDLIIKALEALPGGEQAKMLLSSLMAAALVKDPQKAEALRTENQKTYETEMAAIKDDLQVLVGKVAQLKKKMA